MIWDFQCQEVFSTKTDVSCVKNIRFGKGRLPLESAFNLQGGTCDNLQECLRGDL